MASVQSQGNKWSVVVYLGKVDGKKKYQWISGFKTHKQALLRCHEIEAQQDKGLYVPPGKMTLEEYLNDWLSSIKAGLAPRTFEGYEQIIRHYVLPELGKLKVSQVKKEVIQHYCDRRLETLSPMTVKHHKVCLHTAFAFNESIFPYNPASKIKLPPAVSPEMQTLSPENLNKFLEAAKDTIYYTLFYVLLYTGLRRSEALALRWIDLDLDMCQLSVSRALHRIKNETIIRQTKTLKSRRLIDLTPSTALLLRALQDKQKSDCNILHTEWTPDRFVFSDPLGNVMLPDTVSQAWAKIMKGLGLHVRLHDARHTHATLLLKQGVPAKVVQERLGHANISTTLNIYSHVLPGMGKEAALNFDKTVNGFIPNKAEGLVKD